MGSIVSKGLEMEEKEYSEKVKQMSLEEAIKHCENIAKKCANKKCSMEHQQLAKWLKELMYYKNKN